MLKAIIFDFDGIIAHTEPIHLEAFQKTLNDIDIDLSDEEYYEKYIAFDDKTLFQEILKEKGFNIGKTNTCVTPVFLEGDIPEAMALVRDLRENYGIFCSIVVYPVIPKGLILLRMIPTATHTLEDVRETLDAFDAIRTRLENGTYKRLSAAVMAAMGE